MRDRNQDAKFFIIGSGKWFDDLGMYGGYIFLIYDNQNGILFDRARSFSPIAQAKEIYERSILDMRR